MSVYYFPDVTFPSVSIFGIHCTSLITPALLRCAFITIFIILCSNISNWVWFKNVCFFASTFLHIIYYWRFCPAKILNYVSVIVIIIIMQGIYTYIPETNHIHREYSVAAILSLLFMVTISLVPALALLYFYVSTFRSMCAVPNMVVFCSSFTSWFPGMLFMYFLNDFEMVPVVPIIIIIIIGKNKITITPSTAVDNNYVRLLKSGFKNTDSIPLSQYRAQWWVIVYMVLDLRFHNRQGTS